MGKFIELSKIERQLLLYEIFLHCEVTEFAEITSRLPINKRMIQRDIVDWEKELENEDGEAKEYFTAKDSYYELFPESSERTRQRDFKTLRRIGHEVGYDNNDHCFVMEEDYGLREDFDVKKRGGKLIRRSNE